MQVEKAPLESYADVGGLEQQVQEIKEAVELPLTHPELYEDIGIKPPKVLMCCHPSAWALPDHIVNAVTILAAYDAPHEDINMKPSEVCRVTICMPASMANVAVCDRPRRP